MAAAQHLAPFGVLDLGASRTLALIGAIDETGAVKITGIGAVARQGANDDPVRSMKIALARAEQMAGAVLESVAVVAAPACLSSRRVAAACRLDAAGVSAGNVRTALNAAAAAGEAPGRNRLLASPLGYQVDDGPLCADPRERHGDALTAHANIVSISADAFTDISDLVGEVGLNLNGVVAGPQAAALACLSAEERDGGAIALDIGANSVGLAIYAGGALVHCQTLAGGADAVTAALAQALGAPIAVAERAKLLFGGFAPGAAQFVDIPCVGGDGRLDIASATRADITTPINAALEQQFTDVRAALMKHAPVAFVERWPVAITGGGAEMTGIEVVASKVIGLSCRVARPLAFPELSQGAASGSVSAAAGALGLLAARQQRSAGERRLQPRLMTPLRAWPGRAATTQIGKMAHQAWDWLRTNF
jgi:cell division protein FtsA